MSNRSDIARLEMILKYIGDIQIIVARHGSVHDALVDMEGQYALMMCLSQIGENMKKIKNPVFVSQLPVAQVTGMRNRIFHDYEGIDYIIAENTISESLPELKDKIISLLKSSNP